jgi:hypothetical protein
MWEKIYLRYACVMAPYGAYRFWRSDLKPPYDLYGHRFAGSILNGIWYASPYGVCKLFNLMNRVNIYYEGRDPSNYPRAYEEFLGTNPRVL